jgi:hypothetical protein
VLLPSSRTSTGLIAACTVHDINHVALEPFCPVCVSTSALSYLVATNLPAPSGIFRANIVVRRTSLIPRGLINATQTFPKRQARRAGLESVKVAPGSLCRCCRMSRPTPVTLHAARGIAGKVYILLLQKICATPLDAADTQFPRDAGLSPSAMPTSLLFKGL